MTDKFYDFGEFRIKLTDDILIPNPGLGAIVQIFLK